MNQNITIVIPAHNEEAVIGECVRSILKNGKGRIKEVIVVDNASNDATSEKAREAGARVVLETQKGTGHARQAGFAATSTEFVGFLDADSVLPEDWVDKVEDFFPKNPKAVSLSGPYRYYDGSWWRVTIMNILWYLSAPIMYRIIGYMILGGNFVVRSTALKAIGGFNTAITFYGDDTDTARRLRSQGKVVFKMNFNTYSSARRFETEGLFKTNILYVLNFVWPVIFHRPFTNKNKDVRIKTTT